MARFRVSDPETGLTATLEGDSAPTEQELVEVFSTLNQNAKPKEEPGILSKIGSTISSGITRVGEAMASQQLPQAGVPAVTVPRFGEPGTLTRGVSEGVSGLIEGATTPEGIAALGLAAAPVVGTAVRMGMLGAGAKATGQLAGEASVTGSPETIGQAAVTGLATGLGGIGEFGIQTKPAIVNKVAPASSSAVEATVETLIPESRRLMAPRTRMPEFTESTLEPGGPPLKALPAPGETAATKALLPASELGPRTAGYRIELPIEPESAQAARQRWSKPIDVEAQVTGVDAIRQLASLTDETKTPGQPYKPPSVNVDLRQLEKMMQRNTVSKVESWADEVINNKLKEVGANPFFDAEFLAAAAVKSAILVRKGVADFTKFSEEMRKQFGVGIEPRLRTLYDQAVKNEQNKPAPVAPEQAQPAVAPTTAAASEAKTSGVTAPEAPSAISEATTPVEVKQTAPAEPSPFRPEALETPASKTVGAIAPGINPSSQTKRTIGDFLAQFRVRGHFPKEVHEATVAAEGLRNKWDRNIAYSQRDLMRALGEVYKIGPLARLGGGSRRIPSDAVRLMDDYMKGQVANPTVIPPKVRGVLDTMRNQIDSLSDEMVQMLTAQRNRFPASSAQWKNADNIIEKIKANREIYAHRSYKFFDDNIKAPDWWDDLPSDIKTNAEDLLLSRNPAMTRNEAISNLQAWLSDLKETGGYGQAKEGAKDITILLKRKVIDPELRALLGEHRDPVVNYAKSVSKMADWISNQRFLEEVKRQGMGRFLFEDGSQPPGFSVKLAAEGSDSMSPLNGLRTTQEIADAFNSAKEAQVKNPVWKGYLKLNAYSKVAATAQSMMGHARNLLSRGPMAMMAGHYDVTKLPAVASKIYQDLAGSDVKARDYLNRATELRVIHDSARGGELRAVLKDANLNDYPGDLTSWSLMRAIRKVGVDVPSDLWRLSDDIGNLLGWEIEKANQKKVNPTWTDAKVEAEAAKIVRDIYPFYSETPKIIQGFRKLPVGPFVTFPYQVFRTTWNSISRSIHEVRSANPAERQLGYKRMAGQLAALTGGYALQEFSKMALGISDQQEEDFRRGQPSWSKNNKFVFTGKEPGKLDSINLSYTDPYAYLSDPAVAILSGLRDDRDPMDVLLQTAAEGLRPFVSEQMLANALKEVAVGKTDEGRDIWNATDSWLEKSQKIGEHVGQVLLPGTAQRIERRILPAARNEQPLYGRKLELGPEIFREASGVAVEKYDFKTGLAYNSRDFIELENAAEDHFRKVLSQTKTTSPQDMVEAYKESDRRRFEIWSEFRKDYLASVRNGVSPDDALNLMVARGVDRKTALAISEGTYVPLEISKQAAMRAQERNREIPLDEINTYRQSVIDRPLTNQ